MTDKEIQAYQERMLEMAKMGGCLMTDEVLDETARTQYRVFQSLVKAGFTPDQAALVLAHNLPSVDLG